MGCTIDTSGFLGALDSMARVVGSGEATDGTLRAELGKVLSTAVRYTDEFGPGEAEEYGRFRLVRKFHKYAGGELGARAATQLPLLQECTGTGNTWWITAGKDGGRAFHIMNKNRRWSAATMAAYLAERADREADFAVEQAIYLPKVRASAGILKKSWVEIGDALGIEVTAPGYARTAVAQSGRNYTNGRGIREETLDSLTYTLENVMPALIAPRRREDAPGRRTLPRNDGLQILQDAFNTRDKAIMIGIEKGIFDDMETALRRFPGVAFVR